MRKNTFMHLLMAAAVLHVLPLRAATKIERGFTSLFDGKTLSGWKAIGQRGEGYVPKDGILLCPKTGGGNLFTEKEFDNFIFRFEFRLSENGNNGVGIRTPFEGDAAYLGMEIQVLDDNGPEYRGKLQPWQYHGSIYNVVPAKPGSLKPPGEWNSEEILADGRHIKVTVNGKVIVDANLNDVRDPKTIEKHPGMLRPRGHIGFLGHGTEVAFRNLRVKELPRSDTDNMPPPGFAALFNGKDLTGWKGLLASPNDNPSKRAKLAPDAFATEQAKANERMRQHWKVENGVLVFDGKGDSLCTMNDYGDFEFLVDWKIHEKGDSGIYLRGTPQVQIWDPKDLRPNPKAQGSGGLYNNQKNPSGPLQLADNPIGQWNRFRIV
ncbi:MAG: DUF1080 domain-containing protein, partial [Verrucomicrobiales bacterium]|nr:DUF1080 domain-containing protein [Verrucomicrobiales bacterium]